MHLIPFQPALIFDSPWDIGIILLVVVILFGGKKIPEMMRGLGQGIREFKQGMNDSGQPPAATPPAVPQTNPPADTKK